MDPSRPLVLAAARYASSNDADRDYQVVWGARHGGAFDHMSVAVLAKDTRGVLQVGRHGSTAKDLALGGSVLSAALLILAPAVDATVVAAADVVLPGAKGIAAHLRHVVPDEKLQEVSELLGAGTCGLLIVAIDRRGAQISPLLEHAEEAAVVETKTGDLDAAFYAAIGPATTTGHAALCRHARAAGPIGAGSLAHGPVIRIGIAQDEQPGATRPVDHDLGRSTVD